MLDDVCLRQAVHKQVTYCLGPAYRRSQGLLLIACSGIGTRVCNVLIAQLKQWTSHASVELVRAYTRCIIFIS